MRGFNGRFQWGNPMGRFNKRAEWGDPMRKPNEETQWEKPMRWFNKIAQWEGPMRELNENQSDSPCSTWSGLTVLFSWIAGNLNRPSSLVSAALRMGNRALASSSYIELLHRALASRALRLAHRAAIEIFSRYSSSLASLGRSIHRISLVCQTNREIRSLQITVAS